MAAFAETDVTIAKTEEVTLSGLGVIFGTATFGDAALTYTTGGVPCSKGKFGAHRNVKEVIFTASSLHLLPEYDIANGKIILKYIELTSATPDAPPIEYPNATAPAAMTLRFMAITD